LLSFVLPDADASGAIFAARAMRDQSPRPKFSSKSGKPGGGDKPRGKPKSGRGKSAAGKGPSQRMLRIGEMIRHKLAEMLVRSEIHDDVLASHTVTIPEVRMSADLKIATAYVMPLGGENVRPVLHALDRHKKYIRSEIAQTLDLRYAPDIRFRYDETFDEVNRIDRLLHSPRVRADIEKE
jgi:ribosome-binding factor A